MLFYYPFATARTRRSLVNEVGTQPEEGVVLMTEGRLTERLATVLD